MKRLTLICTLVILAGTMLGQTAEEQKKKINAVKKNAAYIYAEATLEDEKAAYDLAQDLLYQRINEYIASAKKFKGAKETVVTNQNYATEKVQLPRGNMFRAFLYVKKDDIIPAQNAVIGNQVAIKTEQTPAKSTVEELDNANNGVIKQLLEYTTFAQMRDGLAQLKKDGKIESYAKYEDLATPENFVLMIFDSKGMIKAVLSEGKQRKNLRTNTNDDIRNYKGTGAVGVKLFK